jgi:hypothetical protein
MKPLGPCYLAVTMLVHVFNSQAVESYLFHSSPIAQIQDTSLLQPTEFAYTDAMKFAHFLIDHGLIVKSVHRSRLEGFFRGVEKAAFFQTNRGVIEVVFFPGALDAEKIAVTYRRNEAEVVPHRYRIEGQPTNGSGEIEAAYPVYFTMHRNWYIETSDAVLDTILKGALGQDKRTHAARPRQ